MKKKRKRPDFDIDREKRELKRRGIEIPQGAIPADQSRQVPNNSHSPPPQYYQDFAFTCVDCGKSQVWTGVQQKWFYEVAKGSLYSGANRCRACRLAHRSQKGKGGDPNPIKHFGSLMKRVRQAIEPAMHAAGFSFAAQSDTNTNERFRRQAWIEYSRPGLFLRCTSELGKARLIAETIDENANCAEVVIVSLSDRSRTQAALLERIEEFAAALRDYLRTLPPVQAAG